mmetsp:Transcript_35798/g.40627  ORF Transcript_35798/g.40627 Transcript_35798/m.40627 type:complete len:82 (-) Transcript_35798:100-345(-)
MTLLSSLNIKPAHKEKRDPLAREEEDRRAGEGNDTTIDVDASMSDIPAGGRVDLRKAIQFVLLMLIEGRRSFDVRVISFMI